MRITQKMLAIYDLLNADGGWMSAPVIATGVGQTRQNLDYTLRTMIEQGVVERNETVHPIHYKLCAALPQRTVGMFDDARCMLSPKLTTRVA